MVQSMVNLDEEINKKVLEYSKEKDVSKYEAIVELIKLGLKHSK
jgi:hypothetical protein